MGEIMKCKDFKEAADGKIVQFGNQDVYRHLLNCPECAEYFKKIKWEKRYGRNQLNRERR